MLLVWGKRLDKKRRKMPKDKFFHLHISYGYYFSIVTFVSYFKKLPLWSDEYWRNYVVCYICCSYFSEILYKTFFKKVLQGLSLNHRRIFIKVIKAHSQPIKILIIVPTASPFSLANKKNILWRGIILNWPYVSETKYT